MSTKYNGGQAFPLAGSSWERDQGRDWQDGQKGMTLHDYFAAAALTGLTAKYAINKPEDQNTIVRMAFELADVALAERSK